MKSKKGLNSRFFRKRTRTVLFYFWPKSIFFFNFITLVKTVTQRIFDNRFCCLYMSVFVLAKSIFLAFFSLFCSLFTRFYQRTHTFSILTQNKKIVFFFSNCITVVKTVTQTIFDKRFCCFHISAFFLTKSIFLAIFSFFLVFFTFFSFFYLFPNRDYSRKFLKR